MRPQPLTRLQHECAHAVFKSPLGHFYNFIDGDGVALDAAHVLADAAVAAVVHTYVAELHNAPAGGCMDTLQQHHCVSVTKTQA